jgi:hypothetical protein
MTRPFFTKDRISDFELFERHTSDTLQRAKSRLAEGYPIDFQVRFSPNLQTNKIFMTIGPFFLGPSCPFYA